MLSPQIVRPLPKVGSRKQQTREKKRSCAPEKEQRKIKTKTSKKIAKAKKKSSEESDF